MSGSMALQLSGFVLMSVACVTSEGYADAQGLDSHLRPCWCLRDRVVTGDTPIWMTSAATRAMVMSGRY